MIEVICDGCSQLFGRTSGNGGLIFGTSGFCPECAIGIEEAAKRYGEEYAIVARAKPGESFYDFIVRYRMETGQV